MADIRPYVLEYRLKLQTVHLLLLLYPTHFGKLRSFSYKYFKVAFFLGRGEGERLVHAFASQFFHMLVLLRCSQGCTGLKPEARSFSDPQWGDVGSKHVGQHLLLPMAH